MCAKFDAYMCKTVLVQVADLQLDGAGSWCPIQNRTAEGVKNNFKLLTTSPIKA